MAQQLERQAPLNMQLTRRCSVQGAILGITATIADALARLDDIEAALGDALYMLLDIGGVSRGAVLLSFADGRSRLAASSGFDAAAKEELERVYRESPFFQAASDGGQALVVETGSGVPGTEELLRLAGTTSAMIVTLATRGERIGAIFLGSGGARFRLDEWGAFVRTIGAQLAQAIRDLALAIGDALKQTVTPSTCTPCTGQFALVEPFACRASARKLALSAFDDRLDISYHR